MRLTKLCLMLVWATGSERKARQELKPMSHSTIRLFEANVYLCEFDARVLNCKPAGDLYAVILDQTVFYPEGGGQPADQGELAGQQVINVREKPEGLVHILSEPLVEGAMVHGAIDWTTRFARMQHHSGEHIVSGLVKQRFGLDNVGFHMGSEVVTMDFNGVLDDTMLEEVERLANQVIYHNVPVEAAYPLESDLANLDYRSKKALEGNIRIVTIPGADICACCGTHVRHTGEIGIIRLVKAEKYKGGSRVTLLCGLKAWQDARTQALRVQAIASGLSTAADTVVQAVQRLNEELTATKKQNQALKGQVWALETARVVAIKGWVVRFEDDLTADDLRQCCQIFGQKTGRAIILSAKINDSREEVPSEYRYAMFSTNEDLREMAKFFNQHFSGKGGGSATLVQGTIQGTKREIEEFFSELSK
ncbi:MAG: alanyl-tRNA editing protein [Clostridia bacterium]|nr:alanyl-tRNA editing protein [Clostridia bacterium]